tara:strand:- start:117 stop:389 length:273 start_codon:yes stop_codon:yes gene_type:complete
LLGEEWAVNKAKQNTTDQIETFVEQLSQAEVLKRQLITQEYIRRTVINNNIQMHETVRQIEGHLRRLMYLISFLLISGAIIYLLFTLRVL